MAITPLRAAGYAMVKELGLDYCAVKIAENKVAVKAGRSAYAVYVKPVGAKRGRCIGNLILNLIYD